MLTPALDFEVLVADVPRGSWVAISEDYTRVVTYGADLSDVVDEARLKGEENPVVTKVPQHQQALAV